MSGVGLLLRARTHELGLYHSDRPEEGDSDRLVFGVQFIVLEPGGPKDGVRRIDFKPDTAILGVAGSDLGWLDVLSERVPGRVNRFDESLPSFAVAGD